MNAIDHEAIRHRTEAATEGPWWTGAQDGFSFTVEGPHEDSHPVAQRLIRHDATFIAYARTDIPNLLTEVARLQSLVEEAASALMQRGFTDRAQWLRDKAGNGEEA